MKNAWLIFTKQVLQEHKFFFFNFAFNLGQFLLKINCYENK